MPTVKSGDVLGHEFMGEVVEVGRGFTRFKTGDKIVVPFNINCGECRQCKMGNYSCCERSNRNAAMAAEQFGYPIAGLFGYSHMLGGYWGGLDQAILAVRPGGTVSVPGVYGGPITVNMGQIVQKSLKLVSGQTSVKRYLEPLTKLIQEKKVDTTSIISHRSTKLEDGPDLYKMFKDKTDGCTKVVFYPAG